MCVHEIALWMASLVCSEGKERHSGWQCQHSDMQYCHSEQVCTSMTGLEEKVRLEGLREG
jgi:hypothetical protein